MDMRNNIYSEESEADRIKAKRNARRAKYVAEYKERADKAISTARPGSMDEIIDAVRTTNLAYLFASKPTEFTLTAEREVDLFDVSCQDRGMMPAGTKGWLYQSVENTYDKYVWVHDEQYPAKGAKIIKKTTYFTWVCLINVGNKVTIAEAFKTVTTS